MQLVLGTVQFGLAYGVAGRDAPVSEPEVRQILECAWELGIRTLDTAAAYGDIESRLVDLCGPSTFGIITKLPPAPEALALVDLAEWLERALDRIETRLKQTVRGLMFHRAEDLLGPHADLLWQRCASWAAQRDVRLGVSCYDPTTLHRIAARFPVTLAQLPGNAVDQRIAIEGSSALDGIEIHLRSAFLQGLLLMPQPDAVRRVPVADQALTQFHAWRARLGLSPLLAALSAVKSLPRVTHCVVGVDSLDHLLEIADAWNTATPLDAPRLQHPESDVIDPRRWPSSQ